MKYNGLLHSIPGRNHGLTKLQLSHFRKTFSNKIKYNDYYPLSICYYRRKKGKMKGGIYKEGAHNSQISLLHKKQLVNPFEMRQPYSPAFPHFAR